MEYDRIKKILLIDIFTIVIVVGVLSIASSYAYKQEYVTSTADINGSISNVYFIKGKNIEPVVDYLSYGNSTIIRVENRDSYDKVISIDMNIMKITDNLKNDNFKYLLLSSKDIDFSNCNSSLLSDDCSFVVNGDFSYANEDEDFSLASEVIVPGNSVIYYKLVIYVDGDNNIGDNEIYGVLNVRNTGN